MNMGHDFKASLKAAREDKELRQVHFLDAKTCALNSEESKRCTAPGLRETFGYGAKKDQPKPAPPTQQPTVGKKTLKKLKQEAKANAEKAVRLQLGNAATGGIVSPSAKKRARKQRQQLALQNGGVGDGSAAPAGGLDLVGAFGKGKGKGKDQHEGKPICYNWNRGAPCKSSPCTMAHVCLICKSPEHPKKDHV